MKNGLSIYWSWHETLVEEHTNFQHSHILMGRKHAYDHDHFVWLRRVTKSYCLWSTWTRLDAKVESIYFYFCYDDRGIRINTIACKCGIVNMCKQTRIKYAWGSRSWTKIMGNIIIRVGSQFPRIDSWTFIFRENDFTYRLLTTMYMLLRYVVNNWHV